jgi:hypothetical protein
LSSALPGALDTRPAASLVSTDGVMLEAPSYRPGNGVINNQHEE